MPRSNNPVQQEARDRLAKAARRLRALRGTGAEKKLEWRPCKKNECGMLRAKVGRGWLVIMRVEPRKGVSYCSSFGPNSDRSFSGYLPGLTLEEAKLLIYRYAVRGSW